MNAYLRCLREKIAWDEDAYVPIKGSIGGRTVELEQALENRKLLIVGAAGSGKTAFLRHLASLCLCGLEDTKTDSLALPILVRVSELARHRGAGLPDYLDAQNSQLGWNLPGGFFRTRLKEGLCFVLLDGLDENPSAADLIESAADAFPHCRFVVTMRPCAAALSFPRVTIEA